MRLHLDTLAEASALLTKKAQLVAGLFLVKGGQPSRNDFIGILHMPLRGHILAQFHIPVGQVHKMAPTVVAMQREIDLHKRPPFGSLRLAHQIHARFERRAVGFVGVAGDARANDVFPRKRCQTIEKS